MVSHRLLFYQTCLLPQELMRSVQSCGHFSLSILAYGMFGLHPTWIRLNSFHHGKGEYHIARTLAVAVLREAYRIVHFESACLLGGNTGSESQLGADRYTQCWESLASSFDLKSSVSVAEFTGSQAAFSCPPLGQSH